MRWARRSRGMLLGGIVGAGMAAAGGCANPGQPKPPSLRLLRTVTDLSAEREGSVVHLRWTTPTETTDGLPAPPGLVAVVCRREAPRKSCVEVERMPVRAGAAEAEDHLPGMLAADPGGLLAFRVEVVNGEGRSAGQSNEAFAASGASPSPVEGFAAMAVRGGVRLNWMPDGKAGAAVELHRVDAGVAGSADRARGGAGPGSAAKVRNDVFAARESFPSDVLLAAKGAEDPDAGGSVDRSVIKGRKYLYTAKRVRMVTVEGHALEIASEPSRAVIVEVLDTFPPEPPARLEAVAGGGGAGTIDLSWEPGSETDLAGYNVYRAEAGAGGEVAGAWRRLNQAVVVVAPGFSDKEVSAGGWYAYRVTAVDADGNESGPSNTVHETAGTR